MADLTSQVEHHVGAIEDLCDVGSTEIRDEDGHVGKVGEVAPVTTVVRHERVDHPDVGAGVGEGMDEIGTDEAEAPGHDTLRPSETGQLGGE
jgi:hypothetical protein